MGNSSLGLGSRKREAEWARSQIIFATLSFPFTNPGKPAAFTPAISGPSPRICPQD
ncbi:hypothetical protein BCR33DRAFT_722576 [Rhizoclosmatium globosum]|uniref:Uncharacterized protein n=1 Tax=Rhizoclosmatium globosum TaxID=329046 RepID=A0A1Y2BKD4_9FUNG|nr:hypothetical protein BCR33DRAFT_722576 [Rhizoclosmatium globosum]|eukprot:ORY35238.1 hypothetical protein BCR33DRAFT_722576 [Rhizoclosmatium globosum]